jgi:hypothetical protein
MPRLKELSIRRFRGIASGKLEGFGDVNVVVGRNNSGKSTVAEAVTRLAVEAGRHPTKLLVRGSVDQWEADALGRPRSSAWSTSRNESTAIGRECWFRHDQSSNIEIETTWVEPSDASPEKSVVAEADPARSAFAIKPSPTHPIDDTPWLKDFFPKVTSFRPADAAVRIEHTLWPHLLETRLDKVLIGAVNEIFGMDVEQIQLPPDGRLRLLFPTHGVSLDVTGDGTRAALRCLMILSVLDGGFFILEEPECHQHPGSLTRFAQAVCAVAATRRIQLLVTTQSRECVEAFFAGASSAKTVPMLFNLKLEDGRLEARRFESRSVESLLAAGTDPRCLDLYA